MKRTWGLLKSLPIVKCVYDVYDAFGEGVILKQTNRFPVAGWPNLFYEHNSQLSSSGWGNFALNKET